MTVFVDTSALYALMVRTEDGHAAVTRAFRRLVGESRPLVTTSYVVVETVALLQHRLGLAPVRDLDEAILPVLSVGWVGEPLHRKAMGRLLRSDRRRLSLVDCVSLAFMDAEGIGDVLALDSHFAEAGHRVLPGPRSR